MLVEQLIASKYKLKPGERFSYNSTNNIITYVPNLLKTRVGKLALLHEIAHANLKHYFYNFDIELFTMEIEAWEETKRLAAQYNISLNNIYIEECLSSYDRWLTRRTTCPRCKTFSYQKTNDTFFCYSCDITWKVNKRKDRRVRRVVIQN